MITFYENTPQRFQSRKPDELSFLSDNEDDTVLGFNKNKMSQVTANDSAYYSESSNQATTIINPKESSSPSSHHNVILWQKQQQQYRKNNDVSTPTSNAPSSYDNNNDMTSINPLDSIPSIEDWDTRSSDNGSLKSVNSKQKYPLLKSTHELSFNTPEQRTQRIQLRMSQWKEKLEQMSNSSGVSSSSSAMGYSSNSSPNQNYSFNHRNSRNGRKASYSSTNVDIDNGIEQHYSSSRSVSSVNSFPNSNSIFDEKYDSFAEDDRESVFSLRSSNFNPITNTYIPPRSKSSMEVRNPHRNSRIYGGSNYNVSPLKESRIHIMQAELENTKRTYKQKLQKIHQMKQELKQYHYKLEETREKELEQARTEVIEELETTVIKNLKLEIEALQIKLQDTTRELEHSKAYSDMLRNELITMKMNEQSFSMESISIDRSMNDVEEEEEEDEKTKVESPIINETVDDHGASTSDLQNNDQQQSNPQSAELQRLAMLERELKKKNEEILELKRKLDKSTKFNELSKREIDLLNRKVENHRQAREDIEKRHYNLVEVASANEIELNKLRYKLDRISQRQDNALRKMQKRYSSILEVEEEEEEEKEEKEVKEVKENIINNLSETVKQKEKIESIPEKEKEKGKGKEKEEEEEEITDKEITLNPLTDLHNTTSEKEASSLDQTSQLDDTINDILDLSDLDKDSLVETGKRDSVNLDDLLNELSLSDLDDDDDDINLDDISFDDETLVV